MVPLFILVQLVAVPVLMEIMVRFMPQSLRRASRQNHFRMDGTKSGHRKLREQRALGRLRRDLLCVLVVVFCLGNIGAWIVHTQVTPLGTVGNLTWEKLDNTSAQQLPADLRQTQIEVSQQGKLVTGSQVQRYWPWVNSLLALGLVGCLGLLGCGAFMAYGSFAEGVKSRAAEHLRRDTARMRQRDLAPSDAVVL